MNFFWAMNDCGLYGPSSRRPHSGGGWIRARGERLRLALEALGPIFVKFGQMLSTRRDLLPQDIADELAKLQDQVPPFPSQRRPQDTGADLRKARQRSISGI